MCSESLSPTLFQISPPSVDLYTPLPTDTLLRTQLSPVPAHTIFGLEGSIATAPTDSTSAASNTGLNVVPPLTDFHTPPLADPAKNVSRPSWLIPVIAAMRPLIVADPML